MNEILIAVLILTGVGLVAGILLSYFSKVFYVEEDPRIDQVENALPGANCGACGLAGCRDYAKAVASGKDIPACPVGGPETAKKVADIMGSEAGEVEKKVALVKCAGTTERTTRRGQLVGIHDCRSASLIGGNKECRYGCLGFGDCNEVCPVNAIHIYAGGVAIVDPDACIGCGLCVKACPLGIIEMVAVSRKLHVLCSSKESALAVKKACQVGCIGCKICSRKDSGFIVEDSLARYEGTENSSDAPFVCPNNVIVDTRVYSTKEFIESASAMEHFNSEKETYKEKERQEKAAAAAIAAEKKKAAAVAPKEVAGKEKDEVVPTKETAQISSVKEVDKKEEKSDQISDSTPVSNSGKED
ncbi:RnfABCDGE type electron transport complex subunit B [Myxococcota bacterium]|nr:RnfABCDGE type electron transport complex subunit B [Myxococcota bacterium]MBU1380521.1 RnfABCDGE type electron transport complex subunit B [Myxococcota bacterium]MBU1497292.1 RnfABCDGE type electron transport complex subunit B [Myxococcota bacterium]